MNRADLVAICAAAGVLAGCAGPVGGMRGVGTASSAPAEVPLVMDPLTQAGRQALDRDRNGAAVELFAGALASGEERAPALNGLAVAFARIGDMDMAYRYLSEAVVLAPDNAAYAGNFRKLLESPAFARRAGTAQAETVFAEAAPAPQPAARSAAALQVRGDRPGGLVRVNAREVRIASGSPVRESLAAGPVPVAPARAGVSATGVLRGRAPGSTGNVRVVTLSNAQAARFVPLAEAVFAGKDEAGTVTETLRKVVAWRGL